MRALLAQAAAGDAASVINSLGLPVGFLVLTLGALRVMWKVLAQHDSDALQRERDRGDRLELELASLNASVRDRIVPALERATSAMAKELSSAHKDETR